MVEKMLIVDEERHIVRLLEVNLKRAGYAVVTACSRAEALETARREIPDVIVLDEMLPWRQEFLIALRADSALKDIPVMTPGEFLRFRSPRRRR